MRKLNRNMTRFLLSTLAVCMVALFGATQLRAEDADRPTVNISTDILSQYVWRGYALSRDSAVIQPSATASYKGFSLNVWGNLDTDQHTNQGIVVDNVDGGANWNETDLTFSYTRELVKGLNATGGIIYYSLVGPDSFEIYAGLSYALPWLTVGVTGYREIAHFPGWVVQFDLSRNFPLPWYGLNVDLGATFFYQNSEDSAAYPDPGDPSKAYDAWHAGQIQAALNIPIGKYVTVSPKIGYSFPLTDKASDEIKLLSWDGEDNHVFGGIRIAVAF
jgi:hypothetical protein